MSLDVDRAERPRRTKVLAGTTAYATLGVNHGYLYRLLVVGVNGHHLYGSRRTMAGAVATAHSFRHGQTVFLDPHGMAYPGR